MGNWFTRVWSRLFAAREEIKLLIVGLDAAGKTTILYRMRANELVSSKPTIGFNLEEISMKNVNVKAWDLSGQEKMRSVWKHYYTSVKGVIFVLDSSNIDRIPEARDELHAVLAEQELMHVPILILANKQDLPESLSYQALREQLALCGEDEKRAIKIQEASALLDKGLMEGFEWIVDTISKVKK